MISNTIVFFLIFFLMLVMYIFSSKKNIKEGFNELSVSSYVLFIPKRLQSITNTMNGLGISPNYIQGPDKNLFSLEKLTEEGIIRKDWYKYSIENKHKKYGKKKVNTGRVACHLGHLKIMEKFLKTDSKYALIFEDDLHISPSQYDDIAIKIRHILENIPKDAQVVYLSYCWELCSLTTKYNELFTNAVRPLCRHMYMVSREGAKIILDKTIPMYNTGDKMIGFLIAKGILKGYLVNNKYLQIDQNRQSDGVFKTNLENDAPHRLCSPKYVDKVLKKIVKKNRPIKITKNNLRKKLKLIRNSNP
jgi:GR25 family glycosyltransferase involved in LPS biosynthesis